MSREVFSIISILGYPPLKMKMLIRTHWVDKQWTGDRTRECSQKNCLLAIVAIGPIVSYPTKHPGRSNNHGDYCCFFKWWIPPLIGHCNKENLRIIPAITANSSRNFQRNHESPVSRRLCGSTGAADTYVATTHWKSILVHETIPARYESTK